MTSLLFKGGNEKFAVATATTSAVTLAKYSGDPYIFFYNVPDPDNNQAYTIGSLINDGGQTTIKIDGKDVVGSNSPLSACTLPWDKTIRLYYIDSNKTIRELCLMPAGDGKKAWSKGALPAYSVGGSSGLFATADEGGDITVLYMNDKNVLYQAFKKGGNSWVTMPLSN